MPTVTTTQTTKVKLSIALTTKVLKKLRVFEELDAQIKAAELAQAKIKDEVENLFADAGEFDALVNGCKVDDIPLKYVTGTTKYFNKMKLVEQGLVTLAQLAAVTEEKPKKAYLKVTLPGQAHKGENDD